MMKTALLIFLLSAAQFLAAAEDTSIPPLKAIEQFGSISIADGSSFFTFSKDGRLFGPKYLAQFDAFFFYTTGDLTEPGTDGNPPMTALGKHAFLAVSCPAG